MSPSMPRTAIRKLYLNGYRHFGDTVLDFTDPATGKALRRICLIGPNGTGKTTVLRRMASEIEHGPGLDPQLFVEVEHEGRVGVLLRTQPHARIAYLPKAPGSLDELIRLLADQGIGPALAAPHPAVWLGGPDPGLPLVRGADLLVEVRTDTVSSQGPALFGMPPTSLSDALALSAGLDVRHVVSDEQISEMWKLLVYRVHQRAADRESFETRPENLQKTKAQLLDEFNETHPDILDELARVWDPILAPAGLRFEGARARRPLQLGENLEAHVVHADSGKPIAYSALSSGMRNFLFRVGHLFLLFSQRSWDRVFVFIDEPEASLFPDFIFQLMATYEHILPAHAQVFMATHSPIVAAQFEPKERVVLGWDGEGHVVAGRGSAPKGDDPNDLLRQDFGLPDLMGPAGQQAWKEFLSLRAQARAAAPGEERDRLLIEALELGARYGFSIDPIQDLPA